MPHFPVFKPNAIQKILMKNGFIIKRQTGSHKIFYHSETDKSVVVYLHPRDIPIGTLKGIIEQSGLNENIFL